MQNTSKLHLQGIPNQRWHCGNIEQCLTVFQYSVLRSNLH